MAKACGNTFKRSARKEIFGVVLSESLKSFGVTVIAPYIDSQLACVACSIAFFCLAFSTNLIPFIFLSKIVAFPLELVRNDLDLSALLIANVRIALWF